MLKVTDQMRKQVVINTDEGLGDDIKCSKCDGYLDTGLECTECGHDMRPEVYPEDYIKESFPPSTTEQ